jgi:hypothetical protein
MVFFRGGVSYDGLRALPLPELSQLHKEAERVAAKLRK